MHRQKVLKLMYLVNLISDGCNMPGDAYGVSLSVEEFV